MLVVDLACAHGHRFEGWFASADELASQQARGLVSCPVCGVTQVERRSSATRLNVSGATKPDRHLANEAGAQSQSRGTPAAPTPAHDAADGEQIRALVTGVQQQWIEAVRQVMANTEDVGARFADEARAIHHGDAPERAIRGQATAQEKSALAEEGIDVLALPVPDYLKGPLQ